MSKKTSAWICNGPGKKLEKGEIELPPLGPNDVEVKILASGICASDVLLLQLSVPGYQFPLVAGHEGAGVITEVGSAVKSLKPGDRVGVGVYRNCCGTCSYCLNGENNVCRSSKLTFMGGNSGTFAEHVRIDWRFAIPIPEGISDQNAAPLMCAGHTTFTPFRKHNIKVGDKVGIVGIGGLGHLSIQFANKLGCEVYVISSSKDKEKESMELGAHHFIVTQDTAAFDNLKSTLNYIMVTAGGKNLPWTQLIASLAPNGKLILMGGGHENIPVTPLQLIQGQKSVVGSAAGPSSTAREMLHLSCQHKINPIIQKFTFDQINEAIAVVNKGDIRYRAVLVHKL